MVTVGVVFVVLLLQLCLLGRLDRILGDAVAQALESAQVVDGFCSHLAEDHVLEVQEGTGGESDQEATIVGILFTDAAEKSWAIMGQFKGLITEGGSKDGAVAFGQMTELSIGPWDYVVEVVVNERESASLVGASAKQQSLEVLCGSWDSIFE